MTFGVVLTEEAPINGLLSFAQDPHRRFKAHLETFLKKNDNRHCPTRAQRQCDVPARCASVRLALFCSMFVTLAFSSLVMIPFGCISQRRASVLRLQAHADRHTHTTTHIILILILMLILIIIHMHTLQLSHWKKRRYAIAKTRNTIVTAPTVT